MKKILLSLILLLFIIGCSSPVTIYNEIKKKYPNSQIIKLEGDDDQYIIYTEDKEIRFINISRTGAAIEIDQKINLIHKEKNNE